MYWYMLPDLFYQTSTATLPNKRRTSCVSFLFACSPLSFLGILLFCLCSFSFLFLSFLATWFCFSFVFSFSVALTFSVVGFNRRMHASFCIPPPPPWTAGTVGKEPLPTCWDNGALRPAIAAGDFCFQYIVKKKNEAKRKTLCAVMGIES